MCARAINRFKEINPWVEENNKWKVRHQESGDTMGMPETSRFGHQYLFAGGPISRV